VLCFINTLTYYTRDHARLRHARHVPRISPFQIELTAQEREELESRAVKYTLPYYQVLRAKMVLYAAQGLSNDDIARCLDTRREVVSQWRKRFFEERLLGLEERPRPGRPRSFPPRTGRAGSGPGVRTARHPSRAPLPLEFGGTAAGGLPRLTNRAGTGRLKNAWPDL